MDPEDTPSEDLPKKLREELQLLQHYDSIVSAQVSRVIEVAVETWGEAETRAEATAAATEREEQWARDRATCIASIGKRNSVSATNERAADWASIVADSAEHAADHLPVPKHPADRLPSPRGPPPKITGYTGVQRSACEPR